MRWQSRNVTGTWSGSAILQTWKYERVATKRATYCFTKFEGNQALEPGDSDNK